MVSLFARALDVQVVGDRQLAAGQRDLVDGLREDDRVRAGGTVGVENGLSQRAGAAIQAVHNRGSKLDRTVRFRAPPGKARTLVVARIGAGRACRSTRVAWILLIQWNANHAADTQVRVVVKDQTHGLEFFRMLMCLNPQLQTPRDSAGQKSTDHRLRPEQAFLNAVCLCWPVHETRAGIDRDHGSRRLGVIGSCR